MKRALRDAVRASRAWVFEGSTRAGTLERTEHGARFVYETAFLDACRARGRGLALRIGTGEPTVETRGVNLHPFFAGMLPEGLRLRALEGAMKTSSDDLFSLLVACGADPVGDVAVVPEASSPRDDAPSVDVDAVGRVTFRDILAESLDYLGAKAERKALSGAQPKVSAAMISLPIRGRRGGVPAPAILKLEPEDLPALVENEHFFMRMAGQCGLKVAEVARAIDAEGERGLLVRRFDRDVTPAGVVRKLHQEDGCQLLDRYPADKYRVSFAEVAEAVRDVVTSPSLELEMLLRLKAFSYVIGNGDLHARNVSVRITPGGRIELAPAYDLLSTLPYGDRKMALALEGRDDNLRRTHFVALGTRLGLRRSVVEEMLDALVVAAAPFVDQLEAMGLPPRKAADLARLMRKRLGELAR